MTQQMVMSLLNNLYLWFNQIANPTNNFTKSQLEQYFSPDFQMIMNDNIITQDYDSLYAHFNKFRTSGYLLAVQLPLEEVVIAQPGSSGEKKCVAKYKILKTLPGQNSQAIKIMAIWDIDQDNRFRQMNEVVHFEH